MLNNPHRLKRYRRIIVWSLLIFSLGLLFWISPILSQPEYIIADDFSQFWAAGKINIEGGNPYSPYEITQEIQNIGGNLLHDDIVSIMLNPPWALTFIMPFSLLRYSTSRLIWMLLNIALILISIYYLLDIYDGEKKYRKSAVIIIFLFSPTLSAVQKGQFTPLILFGLVLALNYIKNHRFLWIAGIFLALISIKPQLIYLLWIVMLLWTMYTHKWQLLVSSLITGIILTAIPFMVNPHVLSQYLQSMIAYPLSAWATPALGSLLRLLFGLENYWLQFLPMGLGTAIFVAYWWRNKKTWDWIEQSPLIVVASLLTSAYVWTYDAILFIIPIISILVQSIRYYTVKRIIIIFASILLISVLNIILHTRLSDFWFFWLIPILSIWYLLSLKSLPTHVMENKSI